MKSFESKSWSGKKEISSLDTDNTLTEEEAEKQLEVLLSRPENKFLIAIEKNRVNVEESDSAVKALKFAREKIQERNKRTLDLLVVSEVDGVEIKDVSLDGLQRNIESILTNAEEIGRGGDAFVVIDKSELKDLPPEICYKFSINESTPRGRNANATEIALQEKFATALKEFPALDIGVPTPFYSLEVGVHKIIAMEKLNAKSVDDILRGKGALPRWLNVDELCIELERALDYLHSKGLYHRDMHPGNIMISQKMTRESNDKIAFIIDFGLSVENTSDIEPYKSYRAGDTFTYSDDYGIIRYLKNALTAHQKRT